MSNKLDWGHIEMCGIAAILPKPKKQNLYQKNTLETSLKCMLQCMKHRGPDGEGLFADHGIGLAMTRLSIVGGATGAQPIWNEDRTIVVVCNGEIYNHNELRSQLEQDGHVFTTQSDIEVIVHLYETSGEKCPTYLEGIFAFALWDTTQEKLLVARDRFGVKPLYFSDTEDAILFSSELRSLLIHQSVDKTVDPKGLAAFHSFRFVPAHETVLTGIKKLAPGEQMVIQGQSSSLAEYWSPYAKKQPEILNANRRIKRNVLKQTLYSAVKSQVASDVKSGILLSGGLDSTALLAIHRQLFDKVPNTFSVSFMRPLDKTNQFEYSELEQAASVAKKFQANHVSETYSSKDVLNHLPSIIAALDEPIADPTALPLWFACRLAHRSGVKVVYSGEGLDELFNGYEVYRQKYWLQALSIVPAFVKHLSIGVLAKWQLPGVGLLRRSLLPPSDWYQGVGGVFSESEWKDLLSANAFYKFAANHPQDYVRQIMAPIRNQTVLTQMTHFDVLAWLPENTLVKSDKMSMAHSVELRVPFLDRKIVEFALGLGDGDKLRGKVGKWIVRQALSDVLPTHILRRKKAGFPVPLTAWMFNEWREFVMSSLLDPNAWTRGFYNSRKIEQLMKPQKNQKTRNARLLWTLLSLELWYKYVYSAVDSIPQCRDKAEEPAAWTV